MVDGRSTTIPKANYILNLSENDKFGSSIAAYDNLFAIGAPGDDVYSGSTITAESTGAVYIFDFNSADASTLTFDAKMAALGSLGRTYTVKGLAANDNFGSALGLTRYTASGGTVYNLLAIGASGDDVYSGSTITTQNTGAVYL